MLRILLAVNRICVTTSGNTKLVRPTLPVRYHLNNTISDQLLRSYSNTAFTMKTDAPFKTLPTDSIPVMDEKKLEESWDGWTLEALPLPSRFTHSLKPDPHIPTPEFARECPREKFKPRQVKNAHFSWVYPAGEEKNPEVLVVSEAAMKELGLKKGEEQRREFADMTAGNLVLGEASPWAMAYGGWQFGSWAGQLGDGRAMTLFDTLNPITGKRYELQLKGAGLTPYSRFADGKAVLRSSIREFIVSEYLHAVGIPTTRALSLTLLPSVTASRERVEPCAIVTRFAPSWIRIGNFDLFRWRAERDNLRALADYAINECFGGEENLVADPSEDEGKTGMEKSNRYHRFYREIMLRNARVVAKWQCIGFMNGVLNTDNTHIMGLSLDFGPFSFMDNFDPYFTPNHDDYSRRYSYASQPTIIWWNLVRLVEDLSELIGAGDMVDTPEFIKSGLSESDTARLQEVIENFVHKCGEEYKSEFMRVYLAGMGARFGFEVILESDVENIITPTMAMLKELHLDFNHFFRRLSKVPVLGMQTNDEWRTAAQAFLQKDNDYNGLGAEQAIDTLAEWLGGKYRARLTLEKAQGHSRSDEERMKAMQAVNPNFVPRSWVLQEIIDKVEKQKDRDILPGVMKMVLEPYRDSWGWNDELEKRFTGDPPKEERGLQCSCSS